MTIPGRGWPTNEARGQSMIAKKNKRRKPNKRHPVHADSLLRMAETIKVCGYETLSDIFRKEGLRVQKIKR